MSMEFLMKCSQMMRHGNSYESDDCLICLMSLQAGVLELECGHVFHEKCLEKQIETRWSGMRINFQFLNCCICKSRIRHPRITHLIGPYQEMEQKLQKSALEKALEEKVFPELSGSALKTKAFESIAFYECSQCSHFFCGGLVSCIRDMEITKNDLQCLECILKDYSQHNILDYRCFKHGYNYAVFKCDSCCNYAVYDCIFNHYCKRCHSLSNVPKNYPCPGVEKCPLGIRHAPNHQAVHTGATGAKTPFILGCMKCAGLDESNNEHNYMFDKYKF